ncbi:MAG: hypothetical protein IKH57_12295 [Clostridia bacterium]|nr:hypothetical protein [Clostridia bacterium]
MGDKKKAKKMLKAIMVLAPVMEWSKDKSERKKQWKEFKANMETYWDQLQDAQKKAIEDQLEEWSKEYPQLTELEDNLNDSLPDEMPDLPDVPSSEFTLDDLMGKLKEYQELTQKHAEEEASFFFNLLQGQPQAKAAASEPAKDSEENRG